MYRKDFKVGETSGLVKFGSGWTLKLYGNEDHSASLFIEGGKSFGENPIENPHEGNFETPPVINGITVERRR